MPITTRGIHPVRVIVGTSSSVTLTIITIITNEKSHKVMRRRGKVTIRSIVQRIIFTMASITEKIRALVYPFWRTIPGTEPEFAMKNIAPALIKNDTI